MNRIIKSLALLCAVAVMSSCVVTKDYTGEVVNPFETSQQEQINTDNYEELFGKYQYGSAVYSNYNIEGGSTIEYNGGEIELSFDADTNGNTNNIEFGYMAFIDGVPQKLSLNGGKESELVSFSQVPNLITSITLSFIPSITKEMSGKKTLQLKLLAVFNPSYKPSGSFTGFGNAHDGRAFCEYDIKVNKPLEISDELSLTNEYESYIINDDIADKYSIKKPDGTTSTSIFIKDAQTGEQQLTFRDGEIDANLLIYGNDLYKYNVFVYINHERVNFNSADYLETEVKSGYLNVLHLEFKNINERDIVYAVAVPIDAASGLMTARKSASILVLNETSNSVGDLETTAADNTEQTLPPDNTLQGNSEMYSYQSLGYIDDEQRYLLLTKYDFSDSEYKYIIYDEGDKQITARIKDMDAQNGWLSATYGNGALTVQHNCNTEANRLTEVTKIDVYAANGELLKRVSFDECPDDLYTPKYVPSSDCWYANIGDSFCRLNGDMSSTERLTDFPLCDFYVTNDEIVYYKSIYSYSEPQLNADIFGRMDLDGNIVEENKAASYGSGHFRIGRAGDWVYFLSAFQTDIEGADEAPMNGIMLYDCNNREMKTIYPVNTNENAYCTVTPNGKYLVTGILEKENRYTYTDNVITIYDIQSGKAVKTGISTGSEVSYSAMSAFNDRVVLAGAANTTVMFELE